MDGMRGYSALVEITYLGGSLDGESFAALAVALGHGASCTVLRGVRDTVVVDATVRAGDPVAALRLLTTAVDRALHVTGLFDQFDVTGRTVRAQPTDRHT